MIIVNGKFLSQAQTGVQRYAFEIIRELILLRDDVQVVCPQKKFLVPELHQLPLVHIGKKQGFYWEQFELPNWLKKQHAPLLINLCNSAPLFYQPSFVTIHDLATIHHPAWFSSKFSIFYRIMLPLLAKRSEKIITVSKQIQKEVVNEFNVKIDKIEVIYNGLPQIFNENKHKSSFLDKKRQILAVGSFDPRKNFQLLLEAFLEAKNLSDYTLVFVGRASELFTFNDLNVNERDLTRVKILANTTDQELLELYKESEIFVSLSAYEGFGIPILEAISMKCKILISDIPVYRELFSDHAHFTSLEKEAVVNALSTIIQSENRAESLETILKKYSYTEAAISLNSLINSYKQSV
jgi:glycosyltransferase involved in cell wall biosynthesis